MIGRMSNLRAIALPVLALAVVAGVIVAIVVDVQAGMSVALGAGLTAVVLGSSSLALEPDNGKDAQTALLLTLVTFTGKIAVLVVLFAVILRVDAIRDELDGRAFGLGLIAASLVVNALHVRHYLQRRTPTYDLDDTSS